MFTTWLLEIKLNANFRCDGKTNDMLLKTKKWLRLFQFHIIIWQCIWTNTVVKFGSINVIVQLLYLSFKGKK